jgi:hypothetical protein
MWIRTIRGEKKGMEDIYRCFEHFDQFYKDYPVLINEGVIRRIDFDHYEWTKSKTSLAEYFKWIGNDKVYVPGGFWKPIATTFRETQRSLSKLAGNNGNSNKPEKSKNFQMIKKIVEEYREKIKQQSKQEQKDRENFNAIKTLIDKTDDHDIENIRAALEKIKAILT